MMYLYILRTNKPYFSLGQTHTHAHLIHAFKAGYTYYTEREGGRKKGDRGGCISFDLLWVS